MAPIDLNRLRVLLAVSEHGSFAAAAASMGVPRSTISRAITALELEIGSPLVFRTTRRTTLSPEARRLIASVEPSLTAIDAALNDVSGPEDEPRGILRISATSDIGATVLAEAASRFVARWPRVRVDAVLTARPVDLEHEGFDLALRVSLARPKGQTLVIRDLGPLDFDIYAAPSYIARRGAPRSSDELGDHDWVGFRNVTYDQFGLRIRPRIVGDDMFFVREAIRRGSGLGIMPLFLAHDDLVAGTLVRVLPRWHAGSARIFLVRPQQRPIPARTRLFTDVLRDVLRRSAL